MSIYHINTLNDDNNKIFYLGFNRDLSIDDSSHSLGAKKIHNWQPLQLKWCVGDKYLSESTLSKEDIVFNDFVLIAGAGVNIIVSKKAKVVLQGELKNSVQFLSVDITGEDSNWFLINPLNKLSDAISEEKSHYRELSSGRRILRKPVFIGSHIADNSTFVIPPAFNKWYTKGEGLRELVEKNGLTGLHFDACELDVAEAT